MLRRVDPVTWAPPLLAWALLGGAAGAEAASACSTDRALGIEAAFVLAALAAVASLPAFLLRARRRRVSDALALVAAALWFPTAGVALLWGALRCFTF